ncbi:MAG: tetratricopeptide repeat protein [Gammaproteobacteria bacterium]
MKSHRRSILSGSWRIAAATTTLSALLVVALPVNAGTNASTELTALMPFDARIYDISYQIFLANRNLRDAYRIAVAAVEQQPTNTLWRERLAQVSEWNQDPTRALVNWKELAESRGDKVSWDQVRRLAPALFDYRTVVEIMQRDARAGQLDDAGIDKLVTAYENAGIPEEGVKFLRSLDKMHPRDLYLEKIAFLQSRMGADNDALATYGELVQRYGQRTTWSMSVATLHILHGNIDSAYRHLEATHQVATPADTAFLKLYAALAEYMQHPEAARMTYRALIKQNPDDRDLLSQLMSLLNGKPEEAVRIAEYGWKQHHELQYLIQALDLNVQLRRFKDAQSLLDSLSLEQTKQALGDAHFLAARANFYQGEGKFDAAMQDVETAMRITPNSLPLHMQWLWLAIEKKDIPRLRRAARVLEPKAGGEMLDVLAVARVTTGDLQGALPLFRKRLEAHMNDYIWLMDYADVLADTGYPDLAYELRLRTKTLLQKIAPKGQRLAWPMAARLAMSHTSGDPVAQIMRELLALDGTTNEIDNATADALMLWLMRSEQYDRAKLWFWRRYAHALKKPAWAEFAVALLEKDRPKLNEMLADDELRRNIDKYDRVQAAKLLDEPALAREFAFSELEDHVGTDPTLENDLVELLDDTANIIGVETGFGERGGLEGPSWKLFGRFPLTRGLQLDTQVKSNHWSIAQSKSFGEIPDNDLTLEALPSWRHLRLARTSLRLGIRDALATNGFAEVAHEKSFGRLHTRLALGLHIPTEEGTAIRLGGRQDRLLFNADWSFTERSFLNMELAGNLYSTQDGEAIGSGQHAQFTLGHKFRLSYPDFSMRFTAGWYGYRREDEVRGDAVKLSPDITDVNGQTQRPQTAPGSFFLPQDFAQYGIYFGFGERYRENYTHNWRPFIDFGVTWNTVSGLGNDLSAGIGGKVFGDDHLSISFDRASGGGGLGESDQVLWFNYRYFF